MTSSEEQGVYLLSYRRDNVEEDQRLNSQHDVIKHAILDGRLIHAAIPTTEIQSAIADLACGTGIWLDDAANTLFAGGSTKRKKSPMLIGFDVNAHAFNPNPAPGVQLVEHDCTKPFDARYIGKFDLVNIRGLAYAVPGESFSRLIENAVQLLRPGGYLQWLETEARLFKAYPDTVEISEALNAINTERRERGLVPYLPHFMLRQLLSPNSEPDMSQAHPSGDLMTILNFNLLPGGFSRESRPEDIILNERFSETVLESMKLLLAASLIRKKLQANGEPLGGKSGTSRDELMEIQKLMDFIDETRKSDKIRVGGLFPQLIAQRSTRL